ncbi:NAD-dependent epimerase/dehydratase family protein [Paenibacillus kobensis]|uniref:NAD-dependent epimerase/dehydratase family protein n=1 Tax=Paenibacillus kobensis TaxID=59841 RepID=UPI000FDC5EC6|nr:NAD-dependent epimerase/dehydratase family protein [Paenibacillus kobensis]
MKTVVFGASGFIGSHVVEQLLEAGHKVIAVVRASSHTAFLESAGAEVVRAEYTQPETLVSLLKGIEVVYNCTAHPRMHEKRERLQQVEVELTRKLIEAAAQAGVRRFIQLSTIFVYDFDRSEPIDETYPVKPKYTFQQVCMERELVVLQEGKRLGLETFILRPASTIGRRDRASFFSAFYTAHLKNKYPIIGSGEVPVSFIDTRDIGRAMEWLGRLPLQAGDDGVYLVKGFDTSWLGLKSYMDQRLKSKAGVQRLPAGLAYLIGVIMEKLTPRWGNPMLTPLLVKSLTVPRIWNDGKIRNAGFLPKYSLEEAVEDALDDLQNAAL